MNILEAIRDLSNVEGIHFLTRPRRERAISLISEAKERHYHLPTCEEGCLRISDWAEMSWVRRGFDIESTLNKTNGPFLEIGGPTAIRYFDDGSGPLVWDESFSPAQFPRKYICSNIYMDEVAVRGEGNLFLGTVQAVADGSHLPFSDGSLGAVFARAVSFEENTESIDWLRHRAIDQVFHLIMVEEVLRVLEPGGLFFYACAQRVYVALAQRVGFRLEKYSSSRYRNRFKSFNTSILIKPSIV